ncbi:signal recognition particle subunit SRP19/SEC65 family protein [Candidatus Bathyarchaeota archaeon]|nr:signal recognition particle subunit SRP19/SEC65 family protein [Candidatus Bathyarchaeota archaeon]
MRNRDEIALWPVYFDSAKTRKEGRRIPKKLAKPYPSLEEIGKALERLGVPYRLIPDAAYPRIHWEKSGVVLAKKIKAKNKLLKEVASMLEDGKSRLLREKL